MKSSAGLLSLAFVLALPAAAQRASSSGGSHASGGSSRGSSSRGAASSGSSGFSGVHPAHASYASGSSSGGGAGAQASGSGARASGRYIGNASVGRQAPIYHPSSSLAQYIASRKIGTATPLARASTPAQISRRGPYISFVLTLQPGQSFVFPFGQGFNGGFHRSFCGSAFNFQFGFEPLNCFGNSFLNPFFSPYGLGDGAGLYYGRGNYGFTSSGQTFEESSEYEPPSAPGTYTPEALTPAQPEEQPAPLPVTLLALKDGTMYGVTDYWLDHGQLHYLASYGGENSVPLDRVDIDKTVELNSANGAGFNLRSAPAARPHRGPSIRPLAPAAVPDLPF
jgi:hypothetical protein